MLRNNKKNGFTIIEVVLVLAIAGLIFLMVFVALPSLQRSQRDTQRRQDMARLATAVVQYQSNNNGNIPSANVLEGDFVDDYLVEFKAPSSNSNYAIEAVTCESSSSCNRTDADTSTVKAYINATCNGENPQYQAGAKIAFILKLEGSGYYCVNN